MFVTADMLQKNGYWEEQITKFNEVFPDGVFIDSMSIKAAIDAGLGVRLFVRKVLAAHPHGRGVACSFPVLAYWYAKHVDNGPREDTRAAACGDAERAYYYALYVDYCPRDDTRAAACCDPEWAVQYAFYVDKCRRYDTMMAASANADCKERYENGFSEENPYRRDRVIGY